MRMRLLANVAAAVGLALLIIQPSSDLRAQAAAPLAASTIPQAQLLQPEELNSLLKAGGTDRPLVLQVGSKVMFDQAHIVGSEYAGPGSREEGLELLRNRVKPLAKDTFIVLYCGCCPWTRCPNIGAAFKTMEDLGFTHVKVLYIAENFGADWVSKGYPVAQ